MCMNNNFCSNSLACLDKLRSHYEADKMSKPARTQYSALQLFVVTILFSSVVQIQGVRTQSPCTLSSGGNSYDLSPLIRTEATGDFNYSTASTSWFLNICATLTSGYCSSNATACQVSGSSMKSGGVLDSLSLSPLPPPLNQSSLGVQVGYKNGSMCGRSPISSSVLVLCDEQVTSELVDVSTLGCHILFTLKSKYGCPTGFKEKHERKEDDPQRRAARPAVAQSLN